MNLLKELLDRSIPENKPGSSLSMAENLIQINSLLCEIEDSAMVEDIIADKDKIHIYELTRLDDKVWSMYLDGNVFRQEKPMEIKIKSITSKLNSILTKRTGFFSPILIDKLENLHSDIKESLKNMKHYKESKPKVATSNYNIEDIYYGDNVESIKSGDVYINRMKAYVNTVKDGNYHISNKPLRLTPTFNINDLVQESSVLETNIKDVAKAYSKKLDNAVVKTLSYSDAYNLLKQRLTLAMKISMLKPEYIKKQRSLPDKFLNIYNSAIEYLKFNSQLSNDKIRVFYHTDGGQTDKMRDKVKADIIYRLKQRKRDLSEATTHMVRIVQRVNIEETKIIKDLMDKLNKDMKTIKYYYIKD